MQRRSFLRTCCAVIAAAFVPKSFATPAPKERIADGVYEVVRGRMFPVHPDRVIGWEMATRLKNERQIEEAMTTTQRHLHGLGE